MARVTEERVPCVHCGTPNPPHWTVCGRCGRDPWHPVEPLVTDTSAPEQNDPESAGAASSSTEPVSGDAYVVILPDFTELSVAAGERLTIGRETNVAAIDGALEPYLDVSRIHLSFESTPAGLIMTDVGSTYGTWLEDDRVEPGSAVAVALGQRVRLGKNCYLKVTHHG